MTTKKSLNFEILRRKWPEIADLGAMAERYVHADPETALVKMRNMIELVVHWIYREKRLRLPQPIRPNLFELIKGDAFLTTHLTFSEWGKVFTDEKMTTAMLVRITHHCEIIETSNDCYRFKQRMKSAS